MEHNGGSIITQLRGGGQCRFVTLVITSVTKRKAFLIIARSFNLARLDIPGAPIHDPEISYSGFSFCNHAYCAHLQALVKITYIKPRS